MWEKRRGVNVSHMEGVCHGVELYNKGQLEIGALSDRAVAVMETVAPPYEEGKEYDEGITDTRPRWFLEAKIRQELGKTSKRTV